LKKKLSKELEEEGQAVISSINKRNNDVAKGRQGVELNEEEFDEGEIIGSVNDGGKLDKLIVKKKWDPETDPRMNKQNFSKKKVKKF
jgi:hypothetical protein